MMIKRILMGCAVLALAGTAFAGSSELPKHKLPKSDNLVIGLCDGETSVEVKGKGREDGLNRAEAKVVSDQLMTEWKKKHPGTGSDWDREERVSIAQAQIPAPAPTQAQNSQQAGAPAGASATVQDGHTYGAFSKRDEAIWKQSAQALVDQGNKVFHDSKALGGTIAVSCDMCHPNAANTHPETYPKYQVQLGRTALLRDMINWCIENPVRGKPLADSDPKLKALEAYIIAQRKGVALEYGKH